MRNLTQDALAAIDHYQVPMSQRGLALEIMIAEAIAAKMSVPATPIDGTAEYFNSHYKVQTLELLGQVNEVSVISLDRAVDLVYQIWRVRYNLVHKTNDPIVARMLGLAVEADTMKFSSDVSAIVKDFPKLKFWRATLDDSKELPNE